MSSTNDTNAPAPLLTLWLKCQCLYTSILDRAILKQILYCANRLNSYLLTALVVLVHPQKKCKDTLDTHCTDCVYQIRFPKLSLLFPLLRWDRLAFSCVSDCSARFALYYLFESTFLPLVL